jgi:hypothetical protein
VTVNAPEAVPIEPVAGLGAVKLYVKVDEGGVTVTVTELLAETPLASVTVTVAVSLPGFAYVCDGFKLPVC